MLEDLVQSATHALRVSLRPPSPWKGALSGHPNITDARAVEQALIETYKLGRDGGTLLNRLNSIAPSNPAYAQQLQRGYELLKSVGY